MGRLARCVRGLPLEDGRGGLADQGSVDGDTDRAGGKNLGQMDEILVERRAVDAEHLARRRVYAEDVIPRIDDDDTDGQVEEQVIRRLRGLHVAPDVVARNSDGLIEL